MASKSMKLLISAPSGFNAREILLPLASLLETDSEIDSVVVVTPAADLRQELFPSFSNKFTFIKNLASAEEYESKFKGLSIDVVLTPTNGLDPNDTLILRAAKGAGIATCTFVASWDNVYKMERAVWTGRDSVLPDYLGVWNEMMQRHALRLYPGLTENKVRIIGTPRFDFFTQAEKIPDSESLRRYIGLPEDGTLIHCATTELYPFDYVVSAIDRASKGSEIKNKLHMYASVHPGGDIGKHEGYKKYGAMVQ